MSTPSPSDPKPERDFLGAMSLLMKRGRPKPEDHDCYVCKRVFNRATEFKDATSAKEYEISGACSQCQDAMSAEPEDEDEDEADEPQGA